MEQEPWYPYALHLFSNNFSSSASAPVVMGGRGVTLGEGRGAPPMEGRVVAPMEGRGVSPGGRGVSPVTVPDPLGRGRSRGRQVS